MSTPISDPVDHPIPNPIGGGHSGGGASALDPNADVFLDGLALNLHITHDVPYQRQTVDNQKQQFDASPQAGEHTLSQWWIRSQLTLHGGSGIKFVDSEQQDEQSAQSLLRLRYDDSRGIDVWTKGEFKRLPDTTLADATSGPTWVFCTTLGGESYTVFGYGTTIKARRLNAGDVITYTVTGMTQSIKDMVIDGSHYYVATGDGSIFSGPINNSAAGSALWTISSTATVKLGWVKQRLMAAINNAVYELAGTGPTLPAALYTHPSPDWTWTSWAEGPNSIVASGTNGLQSSIYQFTIDTSTGTPRLIPGVVIATLPVGEIINCLYAYAGNQMVIGTNRGARGGIFQSFYGTFSYQPISFPSRPENAVSVTAIHGRGPFVYLGTTVDSEPALVRMDLGTQVDQNIYAYAPDLRCPVAGTTGTVNQITVDSAGKLHFAVSNYGVVAEATTYTGRDAWLRTARIRFDTLEPKHFKYGTVQTSGLSTDTVTVSAETDSVSLTQVYSTPANKQPQRFSLRTSNPDQWCRLTFDLTGTATVTAYQVLALPATPRQRMISLPVQLNDRERNRHGQPIGYPGRAKSLLQTLEALESAGDEVTLQCPVLGIDAVRCTVERITFVQDVPPTAGKKYGVGGVATLLLRTTA